MLITLLLSTHFFPSSAVAAPIRCESSSSIEAKVESCTDNEQAAKSAAACHAKLLREWKLAENELKIAMNLVSTKKEAHQQASFDKSQVDLHLTIDKIDSLIKDMQENADLISTYPVQMFDNPYAQNLDTSSDCFKEPFSKIQEIVTDLDIKTQEALRAKEAANQLRGTSHTRFEKIADLDKDQSKASALPPGGHTENGKSNITGLAKDEQKRKAGAPLLLDTKSNSSSEITGNKISRSNGSLEARGMTREFVPSGAFTSRGSLQKIDDIAYGNFFDKASLDEVEKELNPMANVAEKRAEAPEPESKATDKTLPLSEGVATAESSLESADRSPASLNAMSAHPSPTDLDIFKMVSRKYRKFDAFLAGN